MQGRRRCAVQRQAVLRLLPRYSDADWWQTFLLLPTSCILRRIRMHILFNVAFACAVLAVHRCLRPFGVPPPTILTACATAQGLLLIFRTTAAYDRWWRGHRCVREVRQHMLHLSRLSEMWMCRDDVEWLDGQLRAFPAALDMFLTGSAGDSRSILARIGRRIHSRGAEDGLPSLAVYAADRMQGHVTGIMDLVEEMAQLSTVAVARNYSRHTSRFLTVWSLILPFMLIELGLVMPLVVALVSWSLLGIEEIGHSLEDPFNSPTDHVPVSEVLAQPVDWDPLRDRRLSSMAQQHPRKAPWWSPQSWNPV